MIVKSFVLRPSSLGQIVAECKDGIISVVRPEKALEKLLREAARKVIVEKQAAEEEFKAVSAYFSFIPENAQFIQDKEQFVEYVQDYLHKSTMVGVCQRAVEDYVLAQCATLCARAVSYTANVAVLDGRELVVCRMNEGAPVFDWAASTERIKLKCQGKSALIVAGGYARTAEGSVVGVGKGGANLLASLIASAVGAERIEFYVEGEGIHGISAMTYDEAAHYCASSWAPFPSASLWPAKNAGIPIVVKSVQNPDFEGTYISASAVSAPGAVSGVIDEAGMILVTVYGTGLLGYVGLSSSIFMALAKERVNIRFISQTSSEYAISFAVNAKDAVKVENVLGKLIADNPMLPIDDVMMLNRKVGIVTIYGSRMKNVPGVSGKVFSLLGAAGVNVIASAQGGEELSISVVIDETDIAKAKDALKALSK